MHIFLVEDLVLPQDVKDSFWWRDDVERHRHGEALSEVAQVQLRTSEFPLYVCIILKDRTDVRLHRWALSSTKQEHRRPLTLYLNLLEGISNHGNEHVEEDNNDDEGKDAVQDPSYKLC